MSRNRKPNKNKTPSVEVDKPKLIFAIVCVIIVIVPVLVFLMGDIEGKKDIELLFELIDNTPICEELRNENTTFYNQTGDILYIGDKKYSHYALNDLCYPTPK